MREKKNKFVSKTNKSVPTKINKNAKLPLKNNGKQDNKKEKKKSPEIKIIKAIKENKKEKNEKEKKEIKNNINNRNKNESLSLQKEALKSFIKSDNKSKRKEKIESKKKKEENKLKSQAKMELQKKKDNPQNKEKESKSKKKIDKPQKIEKTELNKNEKIKAQNKEIIKSKSKSNEKQKKKEITDKKDSQKPELKENIDFKKKEEDKIKKKEKLDSNKKEVDNKKLKEKEDNKYKKEKENFKSRIISKNINKENIKTKNKTQNSPKKENIIDIRRNKKRTTLNKGKDLKIKLEKFISSNNRSKETLSTYIETISTEGHHKKDKELTTLINNIKKIQSNNSPTKIEENKYHKPLEFEEEENSEVDDIVDMPAIIMRRDKKIGTQLTPIPNLKKQKDGTAIDSNSKDVQNAIVLRRLEYNDYIKNLNKKKPKKPKPKPKPKPKVYDITKVNIIQKMYKGFQTRNINQIINRLKINLCVTELTCLILKEVFIHARRRITFFLLKLYYHDPFAKIDNEVDFTDKIIMKLSDKYYNFNNYHEEKEKSKKH